MSTENTTTIEQPAPAAVRSSDGLGRWDIDTATGEAREWRLIAKEDIEGCEWTFPKGKRLRGFKDLRDGDWCVYAPGQYMESRIFGVPETLLEIVRPAKRPNVKVSEVAGQKE
jgi:hypothetical protein